ncbi:hypothetical protein Abr02nite_81970 [Paractinoplanes brasiliensis]|nr:hypothetical protein Abr02nite_81970 [Actinoplanes brasiliensis]
MAYRYAGTFQDEPQLSEPGPVEPERDDGIAERQRVRGDMAADPHDQQVRVDLARPSGCKGAPRSVTTLSGTAGR